MSSGWIRSFHYDDTGTDAIIFQIQDTGLAEIYMTFVHKGVNGWGPAGLKGLLPLSAAVWTV